MKKIVANISIVFVFVMAGCTSAASVIVSTVTPDQEVLVMNDAIVANVLSVKTLGESNAYQFEVEISSPDIGCDQYADWWEVFTEDGELLYRRVLLHSHVEEQPFIRSGGPVVIESNTVVFVRGHMNVGGYGGRVLKGSVASGFIVANIETNFAAEIETQGPLPEGCAF